MIYFLLFSNTGHIKIGTTIHWQRRTWQLRSVHGQFIVLGVMDGSLAEEEQLHEMFRSWRTKPDAVRCEFYIDNQQLRNYIKQHTHMDTERYVIREKTIGVELMPDDLERIEEIAWTYANTPGNGGLLSLKKDGKLSANLNNVIRFSMLVASGKIKLPK